MITPRSQVKQGFKDTDAEDYPEEGYLKRTQEVQLDIIKDQWLDEYKVPVYKN